jgi:hypothetical protein
MNSNYFQIVFLIIATVVCPANAQQTNEDYWHPNTSILDELAQHTNPAMMDASSALVHDLKRYYQLLRDKKWKETYELSAKAFQEDVQESDYVARAINAESRWGLVNYDVLSAEFRSEINSTNLDEAILICKFTELPNYKVSYSTVFWHKEGGVWRCLSAGPRTLGVLRETRLPIVDWR